MNLINAISTMQYRHVKDEGFKEEIKTAGTKLARALVQRIGELEKKVNQLKADPTTRARSMAAMGSLIMGTWTS